MRLIYAVMLVLAPAAIVAAAPAATASAGGIGCMDATGSYTLSNSTGYTIGGSFDAFAFQLGPHHVIVWMHRPYRVTLAMAGTRTEGWGISLRRGAGGSLRYHSPNAMTEVVLCVYPDSTRGTPQVGAVDGSGNDGVAGNTNQTDTRVRLSNQPPADAPAPWDPLWQLVLTLAGAICGLISVMRINAYEHRS